MILDTTYHDKSNIEMINDLVGRPFPLFTKFRMGGVGSKRMMIDKVSPNLSHVMNQVSDVNYANIELRPGGILIRINKGLQNFTWIIPYYQLVIYKTNGSSIHAQGKFINFKNNKLFKENKKFFYKLLGLKVDYDMEYQSPTMSFTDINYN